jgi:hypothetical protein
MWSGIPFFGAAKNSIPLHRLKPIIKKDIAKNTSIAISSLHK